ncbi:unnamed protein product [Withania somnifera]
MSRLAAYADEILTTKKEAAARIMVSEQKAQCFQEELQVVKEKGLLTVMKLKEMMISKIIEAELTSLSQQRKIEELEAQLEEAEDIVSDLRVELRDVQTELERVSSKEKEVEQLQDVDTTNPGELTKDNTVVELTEEKTVVLLPESQDDSLTTSNTEVDIMNQKIEDYHSCHINVDTGYCYIASPDLPSISLRDEALELYQNGRTQRIHATEGNPSDREILHNGTFSERSSKMNMPTDNFLTEDSTSARTSAPSDDLSKMAQGLSTGKGEQGMKLGYAESSDNKPESIDASSVPYARDEHEQLMEKMNLSEEDIENVCNQLLSIKNLCQQLLKSEWASEVSNRVPRQPLNDRVIKYTYQRKRKREFLSDEFSDRIISVQLANSIRLLNS